MTTVLYIAIVLEMICVNLITVNMCLKKKYSDIKTFTILFLFTATVIGIFLAILSQMPFYGNGNGGFVLAGFIYLFPTKYLYDEKLTRITEIVCSSWIYTMVAFMLAVHGAKLFDESVFVIAVISIQTIFYLIASPFFWKFVSTKFVYILQNIPEKTQGYLLFVSMVWFLAMVAVNLSFIAVANTFFKILAILFLATIAWISYFMIYEVTASHNNAQKMETIATTDYLTNIPNRYRLYNDVKVLIDKSLSFEILYMDLNNFKSVNDELGHLAGDKYLKLFTQGIQEALNKYCVLYRVAGDEFICICKKHDVESVKAKIKAFAFNDNEAGAFHGVCIGTANYPHDGSSLDEILKIADSRMYEEKAVLKKFMVS